MYPRIFDKLETRRKIEIQLEMKKLTSRLLLQSEKGHNAITFMKLDGGTEGSDGAYPG